MVGVGVGVLGREYFRYILCLSRDRRVWGILLLYAVFICDAIHYPVALCQAGVCTFCGLDNGMLPFYAQTGDWRGNCW